MIYKRLLKLYMKNRGTKKTPLEDFTIELLVGILESDSDLLDKFVNDILKIKGKDFKIISTGKYDFENDINSTIDIAVINNESICFIENKVNLLEEDKELERYAKYLNEIKTTIRKGNKIPKVYLRYCTKYYDHKEIDDIDFLQYRWSDVYKFLEVYKDNLFINEYLDFLCDEGMTNASEINHGDLMAVSTIKSTISKMDECLDNIETSLLNEFEKPWSRYNERVQQIVRNQSYCTCKYNIVNEENSYISLGFSFFSESNILSPTVNVELCIYKENSKYDIFKDKENKLQKEFELYYSDEEKILLVYEKSLLDFISSKNQVEDVTNWCKERVIDIKNIINTIEK